MVVAVVVAAVHGSTRLGGWTPLQRAAGGLVLPAGVRWAPATPESGLAFDEQRQATTSHWRHVCTVLRISPTAAAQIDAMLAPLRYLRLREVAGDKTSTGADRDRDTPVLVEAKAGRLDGKPEASERRGAAAAGGLLFMYK